ncbi:hypothetical protein MRX96_048262 [Rhipicephalus microplus]
MAPASTPTHRSPRIFNSAPPSATSAAQPGITDSAPQPTLRGLDSCADMRYPFTPFAFIMQVLAAACRVEPFDAVGSNQSGQRPILLHDAPAPFHPAPKDGPCIDPPHHTPRIFNSSTLSDISCPTGHKRQRSAADSSWA